MKDKQTPLMRQYMQIKEKYPETVLLYRLGDFFETFNEDAVITSKVCGIALTKRNSGAGGDMPLAGFPHHQLDNYLPKLVRAGYRVAVCEQLEDPKLSRGIVKRDVVEVVTPGVALYDKLLESNKNNFVVSLYLSEDRRMPNVVGFAAVDISTGEFLTGETTSLGVSELLESFNPSELIIPKPQKSLFEEYISKISNKPVVTRLDEWFFDFDYASELIQKQFELRNLKGFGIEELRQAVVACGAVLKYISDTQKGHLSHLRMIRHHNPSDFMLLDAATRRNLEISMSYAGTKDGALLQVLDKTSTPGGGRLLKIWLNRPLLKVDQINKRLDAVEFLCSNESIRFDLISSLKQTEDLERLSAKIASGRANPRDCIAIKNTLKQIPTIKKLTKVQVQMLSAVSERLNSLDELLALIDNSLVEEPSVQLGTGSIFKTGFDKDLDDYVAAKYSAKTWIADFQENERKRSSINSLKVAFNNVFGYYIEISHANSSKVPDNYERKQTLTNAERYTTPELKQFEAKILSAEEKILEIEQRLFAWLKLEINKFIDEIQSNAKLLAALDCLLSFAVASIENKYTKPRISEQGDLNIINGRHPVVEKLLPLGESFSPNSTLLNSSNNILHIITGPNMSGKSCYLRQTALVVLMGQIGCFVPAESAEFGVVDRIFTRVGAQDNITGGESTFLVEMQEAAGIINNATSRSLILLDEVGRGTATFDGISLAWSIAEYIHNELRAKTLFATHYHELNELEERYSGIKNYKVEIIETGDKIIFTHKVSKGASDHSFGIHVAQLAGLPKEIIERANEIMNTFEGKDNPATSDKKPNTTSIKTRKKPHFGEQLSIFEFHDDAIRSKLRTVKIDNITPVQAFQLLAELLEMAK